MANTGMRNTVAGLGLLVSCLCCSRAETPAPMPAEAITGSPPPALAAGRTWRPTKRFVQPRSPGELLPSATIGSESRPVLRSPAPVTLNYSPDHEIPEDGRVVFRPPLPSTHQHDAVHLAIRVKPGDRWILQPGRLQESVIERGKRRVIVEIEIPEAAGERAGIWVQAFAPGGGAERTEVFRVPDTARLDFAVGVLEPAWSAGPVDFELSVCEGDACETAWRERIDPVASPGYVERALGLGAWRGREVSLVFDARAAAEGAATLPVWADPVVSVPVADSAPSLILVSLDTLRADHVGAYGYPRDTTPFLDELAERGVLFEQYVAASSSTQPSHMTMFTSLQPSVHGATESPCVDTAER